MTLSNALELLLSNALELLGAPPCWASDCSASFSLSLFLSSQSTDCRRVSTLQIYTSAARYAQTQSLVVAVALCSAGSSYRLCVLQRR